MPKSIKELKLEQKARKKQRQAAREGEIRGLLYVRERAVNTCGISVAAAHNLARLIDQRIAEISGPEVV